MQQFLISTHSYFRWLVLLAGFLAIALPFMSGNQSLTKKDKMPALFFMISCDIQLLIGLILYLKFSGYGLSAFSSGMGNVMKNADLRKIAVEHLVMMTLAIVLVHIGYSKIKKAVASASIRKTSLVFFGIALLLILAGIPWNRMAV